MQCGRVRGPGPKSGMAKDEPKKASTIAARAGGFVDAGSGGVVPPLQPSTTFIRDENYDPVFPDNVYGRDHNDQVRLAEEIICRLEGGKEALLFASGMAALSGVFSYLKRGQKLLLQSGIYWGTTDWVRGFCDRREITLIEADSSKTEEFVTFIGNENPDMVLVETPSNPWIAVTDVSAVAAAAKQSGAIFVVDATAASPVLMQPLSLGADIVMHSATKVLNGHSDVLAGVLTCSEPESDLWKFVCDHRHGAGAILSAHSAWMLIRGMRTLPLRLERMCSNALAIARFLDAHEKVEAVWYSGLKSNPGHELASSQMSGGFGYLMSFLVRGGKGEALSFCQHLRGIHRATSLGGTESLVEHRHTIEGDLTGCPENLIRLSVGIEDEADLIAEIDAALSKI